MNINREIPKEQKDIMINSLGILERVLETIEYSDYVKFDIMTLKALLKYKITVELSKEDYDSFASKENIDFPEYK